MFVSVHTDKKDLQFNAGSKRQSIKALLCRNTLGSLRLVSDHIFRSFFEILIVLRIEPGTLLPHPPYWLKLAPNLCSLTQKIG